MLCETSSCYHFNYELLGQQPPDQGKRPLTDQVTNKINSLKQGLKVLLITCFKDLFTMGSFHYRFHNLVSRPFILENGQESVKSPGAKVTASRVHFVFSFFLFKISIIDWNKVWRCSNPNFCKQNRKLKESGSSWNQVADRKNNLFQIITTVRFVGTNFPCRSRCRGRVSNPGLLRWEWKRRNWSWCWVVHRLEEYQRATK